MKFRTFITPLAAIAGLVFVVGLTLLAGLLLRNPLALIEQGGLQVPSALQFVPKQSSLVASMLTRPDRLADVWQYLTTPSLRQDTKRDIEQIERTLLAGTGLVYEQDILPWLGDEVTAAIVSPDLDQNPENGQELGYLIALACKDSQAARATLELFWQNRAIAGDALTFEDFSGNRLIYSNQRAESDRAESDRAGRVDTPGQFSVNRLATTIVANQFVLVANHPEVLRRALNAALSNDNNLAADRRYRSALRALPKKRVGLIALSLPAMAHSLGSATGLTTGLQDLTHLGEPGDAVDWGLLSLRLNRQGILGDMALMAASGRSLRPRQPLLTTLPQVAYYLPGQSTVTAVGLDLKTLWASLHPLWQHYGAETRPIQWISHDLSQVVGTNLTQGLLDSVAGDFALGFNPGNQPDWLLITEQSTAMENALHHLQANAQAAGLGVNPLTIRDQPTTALTRLTLKPSIQTSQSHDVEVMAQVAGLHTQVNHFSILTSSPTAMEATLRRWESSTQSPPAWTEQLSLFQTPNEGYIHIHWPELQSRLRQRISGFRIWETAARPVLRHLKQITFTSYGRTHELQTGEIFFQLSNQ